LTTENHCIEAGCDRLVRSRNRCQRHYEAWRKANPDLVVRRAGRWNNPDGSRMNCFAEGCDQPISTQGFCYQHYQNFWYESTRGKSKKKKYRKVTGYDGVRKEFFCTFEGCDKPEFNPGLCAAHYYQKLRGEELRPIREKAECTVPGCTRQYSVKHAHRPICRTHISYAARFSISVDRLMEILAPNVCANPGCGSKEKLCIDHDHACCPRDKFPNSQVYSCGECIRGLLCESCNHSLGRLQEDPRRIEGLLRYLEATKR
jgi:hypothetical protein